MPVSARPIVLMILDGWGYSAKTDYNAIAQANTPNWDNWWQHCPHTLIAGSGPCVGLPDLQMGNSEVGHMHLGAGRVIDQDLTRIDKAIADKSFFSNPALVQALSQAKKNTVHILGLLSPGGVHSHENHFHALIDLAAEQDINNLAVHAFLDGRDTPPQNAAASLAALEKHLQQTACGKIASVIGRYYAMDRDERWERIQAAYDLLTAGQAPFQAGSAGHGLALAYERGEQDEFVQATIIGEATPIQSGDVVIFMNFRADRARQLSRALTAKDFAGFARAQLPQLANFTTLTQYATDIESAIVFPPQQIHNSFGEYIAQQGLRQLRIAETEKYAHVTFFFNGGVEKPYDNEQRTLIPSPKVATYDLQPEMSAPEVTDALVAAINSQQYDVIIANFANADMVGHSGDFAAAMKAVECIDTCLGQLATALKTVGGEMLITADHGNAEKMHNEQTGQAHTAHTSEPVPVVYLGRDATITKNNGSLIDVAPTLLYLLGLTKPTEMTGESLLKLT